MLAIFHKAFAHPPQELNSPGGGRRVPKNPEEILREFHSLHPGDSFSATFSGGAALACYGLCKNTNEALLVIEAYRTLRDRGPYPADQVLKDLGGSFAFVLYDSKAGTVFAALSADGKIPLYWGIAADGSVVICDDVGIIKGGCGKSYAPFPTDESVEAFGFAKLKEIEIMRQRPGMERLRVWSDSSPKL
ncbi:stem-specific protein TSJT1-like [Cocos nucifera]|uniref:Stem-specific protein TSJT1-like n=1 Tax=Cocos nucifera TaxID=13894 RepID=A0A8K0IJX9_COCNU|nr:stem-specific protein TSJT1-like [Cocos nucifera]